MVSILKEPPALQDYRQMLISREVMDKQWREAIEKAAALGLDGKKVQKGKAAGISAGDDKG